MKTSHDITIPDSQEILKFHDDVLKWYEKEQRRLPWRAVNPDDANPYHVWLSEIMLQQTTVSAVIPYFLKFTDKWPTVHDLANAAEEDIMDAWAGLGYYSRARNLLKCAKQIVDEHGGALPSDDKELLKLAGIGPYTAGAISSIAYNKPVVTIDGNIDRVFARYHSIKTPFPDAKTDIKELANVYMASTYNKRPSEFVQALMDLGATICQPKKVQCSICPLQDSCKGRAIGNDVLNIPAKVKKQKPQREALCFVVSDKDQILIERRPSKGLLANMLGFPTTPLNSDQAYSGIDKIKKDEKVNFVEHVFTHFALKLYVVKLSWEYFNEVYDSDIMGRVEWVDKDKLDEVSFPTLFKKVKGII